MPDLKEGYYYLKSPSENEPVLVRGYYCTDLGGEFAFGFNAYDGGGLLPISELTADTTMHLIEIPTMY
jgi:hypothetical protein